MTKIRNNTILVAPPKMYSLDTLAQLDGNFINVGNRNAGVTLQRRAFAKYYTNKIIFPLINLNSPLNKSYWNTFHCVSQLQQNPEGKITSKYCKNRWCIVCNKIRTGILHNTHKKSLEGVKTKFITLTSRYTATCRTKKDLAIVYELMIKAWQKSWRSTKEKYGNLMAIRKTEITWKYRRANGVIDTYHPHFHIILEGNNGEAEYLVSQWLKNMPNARLKSQDIKNADEKVFNEMFKYVCKMWSKELNRKTGKHDFVLPYPADKMNDIFEVLHGKRTIQTYNLKKVELDDFDEELHATIFVDEQSNTTSIWDWEQELRTWINYETGELRSKWVEYTKKDFDNFSSG